MPIQPRDFFKLGTRPLRGGVFSPVNTLDELYPTEQVPVSPQFQPYADQRSFEPYVPPQQQVQTSPYGQVIQPEQNNMSGLYQLASSNPEFANNPYIKQYLQMQDQAQRHALKPETDRYVDNVAQMSPDALKRYKKAVANGQSQDEAFAQEYSLHQQELEKKKAPPTDSYMDNIAGYGSEHLADYQKQIESGVKPVVAYSNIVSKVKDAERVQKEAEKVALKQRTIDGVREELNTHEEALADPELTPIQRRSYESKITNAQSRLLRDGLITKDELVVPFYTADGAELVPAPLKKKIESMKAPSDDEKLNWLKSNGIEMPEGEKEYPSSAWKQAYRGVQTQRLDALREQGNVDPYNPEGTKAAPADKPAPTAVPKVTSEADIKKLGLKKGDQFETPDGEIRTMR